MVTAPALAGVELAALEAGDIEVEPVNVGLDREEVTASLRSLGEDRSVFAAVVAPWTAPPPGAIELLGAEGVPVVTLSWAWGPPGNGDGLWVSLVAGRAREAVDLLSGATRSLPGEAAVCLAGDDHVTSRALLETAEQLGQAAGDPQFLIPGIASMGQPTTSGAVAARIREAGCPVLVWIGGTQVAASVLSSIPIPPSVLGTSRMKTDGGLELASSGVEVSTVCACEDITLSIEERWQRFVHDFQAESGAPPGPFAVEAYDAAWLLIGSLRDTGGGRAGLASALGELNRFSGLAGTYSFETDGSRAPEPPAGIWGAVGSRWLPEAAPIGPPA